MLRYQQSYLLQHLKKKRESYLQANVYRSPKGVEYTARVQICCMHKSMGRSGRRRRKQLAKVEVEGTNNCSALARPTKRIKLEPYGVRTNGRWQPLFNLLIGWCWASSLKKKTPCAAQQCHHEMLLSTSSASHRLIDTPSYQIHIRS